MESKSSKVEELQYQLNKLRADQKKFTDEINSLTASMYSMLSKKTTKEIEDEVGKFIELNPSKY